MICSPLSLFPKNFRPRDLLLLKLLRVKRLCGEPEDLLRPGKRLVTTGMVELAAVRSIFTSVFISLILSACVNSEFRFDRIDITGGGQSTTLPFKLQTMSGIRNGASVNAQARFGDGSDSGQMNLEIHLGPPPQFVSGTYRVTMAGQTREGIVDCESLSYLGGQADTPSVGGTFVFKDSEGRAIYRLKMPPTAMVRSR
jgi:hypothetical protein